MSIETQIEHLHKAIHRLCDVLESKTVSAPAPVVQAPQPVVAAPVPTVTVSVPQPAPTPAPTVTAPTPTPVASAPAMPAPPAFEPPAPAPAPGGPFSDPQGFLKYVMDSYKAMGAEKGAGIQTVLTTLGYQNINEVKPEHYGAFYAGVEALK